MRVLVIGDTHVPFEHKDYLNHCKQVYKTYKCNTVVHIGDVVDMHASSYHESDVDGMSAGDELTAAKRHLEAWYKAFPKVDVIAGNHCRIVARKALTAGISKHWLRSFQDVLGIPNWTFQHKLTIDGVFYTHGEGVTARTKLMRIGKSVVQGHRHTEGYVWYTNNSDRQLFGMQVGTGVDAEAYAFAYAKDQPDPVLSCGVVLEGKEAHIIPML